MNDHLRLRKYSTTAIIVVQYLHKYKSSSFSFFVLLSPLYFEIWNVIGNGTSKVHTRQTEFFQCLFHSTNRDMGVCYPVEIFVFYNKGKFD